MKSISESDEEDYENFFLQPTSSPYNIADKVQKANKELYDENFGPDSKNTKVKFKENLVDFEPSYTDDDVNSIESDDVNDNNIDYMSTEKNNNEKIEVQVLEYKIQEKIDLNVFDINETIDEEIIEEITPENNQNVNDFVNCNNNTAIDENENENEEITSPVEKPVEKVTTKAKKKNSTIRKSPYNKLNFIECKNHCIERLDFELNLSINKLNLQEKPRDFPNLKLQRRKCCEKNKSKNQQQLPSYTGFRSEYGLSSLQLERREKRKEILMLKEQRRQQLMEEYKERKVQQNEQVFNEWLKDIERRRQNVENVKLSRNQIKKCLTPNVISVPPKHTEMKKERPKTANSFVSSLGVRRAKRPHTSPACVYIEVPSDVLRRGISIGDLLVTDKNNAPMKKLHILTLS